MDESNYETSFGLILHAGDSKSKSLMAIEEARAFNFEEARRLVKEAQENLKIAHQTQTELIQSVAKGGNVNVDVLLVHAQDHLTTAMIMVDQAQEFIHIYELLKDVIKGEKSK
ncbi:PTS lactose/cellobiose transporter subunit IIA [[Eubacterium] hominis]|uniref:PTS lactose/cellobiose transporter subunit IIA n=1 Tax=[Eubacterium] hominis TaxID=2764325 RepID=UPI003A4D2EE9